MSSPSDAPVRPPGTHTRSGNAMARTRAAILDAAASRVEHSGVRKTTMSDVAAAARVAKATLYNHFRTKDDLLDALVLSRIEQLTLEEGSLADALEQAAAALGADRALRRVVQDEPAVLAVLAVPGKGRLWDAARTAVTTVLSRTGAPTDSASIDVVLRWLVGHALWPGTLDEVALGARVLEEGLGRAPVPAPPAAPVRGLGWPG